jgi:RNA polymerase sigma-70 factor (ECF subfamily)
VTHSADDWRDLLARHGPALVLYARQFCATHAAAEDAVQEAFVRCWPQRATVDEPLAYLYRAVRTAALDATRGEQRRAARERRLAEDEPRFEPPAAAAVEEHERLTQALAALPAEQREVVVMKIWGVLTFLQIADALDIPPNTAASRYRYALAHLARTLAEVKDEC